MFTIPAISRLISHVSPSADLRVTDHLLDLRIASWQNQQAICFASEQKLMKWWSRGTTKTTSGWPYFWLVPDKRSAWGQDYKFGRSDDISDDINLYADTMLTQQLLYADIMHTIIILLSCTKWTYNFTLLPLFFTKLSKTGSAIYSSCDILLWVQVIWW